jgi:hypothetical protein
MSYESSEPFVSIRDASGRVTGIMDRATADYLESQAPDPTQQSIDSLLSRITRVLVVGMGYYRQGTPERRTLLDTSDIASIAAFRECFAIVDDPRTFGHCMCCGEPHFYLYAEDELVATIGYHHGMSIRWDAWKHDAVLKDPDRLLDWTFAHGVDGPQREVEEMRRRGEESQIRREQWLQATPDCLGQFQSQECNEFPKRACKVCAGTAVYSCIPIGIRCSVWRRGLPACSELQSALSNERTRWFTTSLWGETLNNFSR